MMRPMMLTGLLGLLASCAAFERRDEMSRFDGVIYRADLAAQRGAPTTAPFTVRVRDAGQGLAGAREAGRYEAIQHCLRETASSEIEWTIGPDSPAEALRLEEGALVLQGRCVDPR